MFCNGVCRPLCPKADNPTLLVLRHHGLGDLLTVQPALRGLRRRFPLHRLVVTCPSWLVPLALHFNSADQVLSEIAQSDQSCCTVPDPTKHQDIDNVLLDNVLRTVKDVDTLVSLRTPGPELIQIVRAFTPRLVVSYKYAGLDTSCDGLALDFSDHILTRWRRLLSTMDVDVQDSDLYAELPTQKHSVGFTVVHVGAGSPSRLWPIDRWANVIKHLFSAGHRIALTGSGNEAPLVRQVCEAADLSCDTEWSTRTDIMQLAHLVAGARLVLSTDTGVSHLATTFRRPAITLFGPVPPAWWGPPPGNPQHKTLWTGRIGDNYGERPDPGLLEISVESVIDAIEELRREGVWN